MSSSVYFGGRAVSTTHRGVHSFYDPRAHRIDILTMTTSMCALHILLHLNYIRILRSFFSASFVRRSASRPRQYVRVRTRIRISECRFWNKWFILARHSRCRRYVCCFSSQKRERKKSCWKSRKQNRKIKRKKVHTRLIRKIHFPVFCISIIGEPMRFSLYSSETEPFWGNREKDFRGWLKVGLE